MLREGEVTVEHELFVRSFFTARPPQSLTRQLASSMRDMTFPKDAVIYEAGRPARQIFFVVEGEVALEREGLEAWRFGPHSLVGILDALLSQPYTRRAVAKTHTQAMVMDMEDYFDAMEDHFDFSQRSFVSINKSIHELALGLPEDLVLPNPQFQVHQGEDNKEAASNTIAHLIAIRKSDAFCRCPIQALATLARLGKEERFGPHESIYKEGDPAESIRLLLRGRVKLTRKRPKISAHFSGVDLLGGTAAFGYEAQAYSAETLASSVILRIGKEDLFDVMEVHFGMTRGLFAYTASERERVMRLVAEVASRSDPSLSPVFTRPGRKNDGEVRARP